MHVQYIIVFSEQGYKHCGKSDTRCQAYSPCHCYCHQPDENHLACQPKFTVCKYTIPAVWIVAAFMGFRGEGGEAFKQLKSFSAN